MTASAQEVDFNKLGDYNCPICKQVIPKQIYQCNNGHIVCDACNKAYNGLERCPLCNESREISGSSRNTRLEEILDLVKFDCRYKKYGCKKTFFRQALSEHEDSCKKAKKAKKRCDKAQKAQAKQREAIWAERMSRQKQTKKPTRSNGRRSRQDGPMPGRRETRSMSRSTRFIRSRRRAR